jgi:PilZ domain
VDVAALFREYVSLDRRRGEGGLSTRELHRWQVLKKLLSRHFSPDTPVAHRERRQSVRVPARVQVGFATEGAPVRCLLTRISRHGAFVQTEHAPEPGARFALRIHERSSRAIYVPVEVVSRGADSFSEADHTGMGLRFLEAPADVRKRIDDLYERSGVEYARAG